MQIENFLTAFIMAAITFVLGLILGKIIIPMLHAMKGSKWIPLIK